MQCICTVLEIFEFCSVDKFIVCSSQMTTMNDYNGIISRSRLGDMSSARILFDEMAEKNIAT